ncbi:hypothetical protein LCGC14_1254240 [marine sediment metagenome]|uniref:Uncharacterized protein n=1 Tax=marine sediment metagenome TaxID=412755 RepID=A0A0F9LNU4_9ZZZZ
MSTFVKYVDEVKIPGGDLGSPGSWNTVDVSPYMQDTSAIGVTLRAFHAIDNTTFGVRTPGALFPPSAKVFINYYVDYAVSFGGSGNTVEILYSGTTVGWKVFVTGEIHGDHAALHDAVTEIPLSEPWSTWKDVQVTPIGVDVVGDIAAVIVQHYTSDVGSRFGLREKGDSRSDNGQRRESSHHWYVVGVDANGYYQIFTSGKVNAQQFSRFYETGYILKTGSIVTLEALTGMGLAEQDGSYAAIDFSSEVSSEAFIVGGRWHNPLGDNLTRNAFLRATGSAEDTNGIVIHKGDHSIGSWVGLDVDLTAEYQTETAATPVDFFVEWYELVPSELFLWDADTRRVMGASALPTPALDAGSGARSPLEAAPGAPETPIDAEAETETPFDAEAETGPQEP